MIFIDCPSTRHIASVVRADHFKRYQTGGEFPVHCIIHLAGPGVLEDVRYQQWLGMFGDGVNVRTNHEFKIILPILKSLSTFSPDRSERRTE